jgi:hypothetical protein
VSCPTVAGSSFGANSITCTATDGSGNQAPSPPITITVLEPLQVVFDPPIHGAAGAVNRFTVGQTIPHKVRLLDTRART